jgi:hypothetical protein
VPRRAAWVVVAVLVAAAGVAAAVALHGASREQEPAPSPASAASPAPSAALPAPSASATAAAASSASASPRSPPLVLGAPIAPLAGGGEHAFVADASGLVEVAVPGGSHVIAPGGVGFCRVDARARVVWFSRDDAIYTFDLVDRTFHLVLEDAEAKACASSAYSLHGPFGVPVCEVGSTERAMSDVSHSIIDWGDGEQLGGESEVHFALAVAIAMRPKPSLDVRVGCQGDGAWYCFEETGEGGLVAASDGGFVLRPELREQRRAIEKLRFADPAYVEQLALRGQGRSLWTPLPARPEPPKSRPSVDKQACEELPDRCGELTPIPWSPLWLVVTSNSRGDFFHETNALWDPRAGAFLRVVAGEVVRETKPGDDGGAASSFADYAGMLVSPGGALLYGGTVFDASKVHFSTAGESAQGCGWAEGGARIPGAADNHGLDWARETDGGKRP